MSLNTDLPSDRLTEQGPFGLPKGLMASVDGGFHPPSWQHDFNGY